MTYPVRLDIDVADPVGRWRPFVHWILAIPHFIVLYALQIVGGVAAFIGAFAILFTGRWPAGLLGLVMMWQRYQIRTTAYLAAFREEYPPFAFPTDLAEPGDAPGVSYEVDEPRLSNRFAPFYQWLLAIPHFLVLSFLGVAAGVLWLIGAVIVLFTGRWPEGFARFLVGVGRWSVRASAYTYFLTSEYPPFSLD